MCSLHGQLWNSFINVIDRDIRQSGEGVEDHTLATVGELDVVVGVGVGGVQTELEPILKLGVDVGTERTDLCTLGLLVVKVPLT